MSKKKLNFDVDQNIFKHRRLFLVGEVEEDNIAILIKQLLVLDGINKKPIYLYINTPGGGVSDGFALIDTITHIKSPVYTVIIGEACSMGGIISIVGKRRFITQHAFWMAHDMAGGIWGDYSGKVEYRAPQIQRIWEMLAEHLKKYTKLTDKDIQTARNGELWLSPEECIKKGVVDKIL